MSPAGEAACRDAIVGRTGAVCEGCRGGDWTDKAHRVARGQGGAWSPGNVLGLCRPCHGWAHSHPHAAAVAGWIVAPWIDPAMVPAFLSSTTLTPGWYWLAEDGGPHGYGGDDVPAAPPPTLPPHYPRRLLLPPLIPVPFRVPRPRRGGAT